MINGQEVEIYEGENRIYIFKEGVESPRPLTDEERRRLLQLRDLMRDPATPKEERAAYAIETQRILKNTRRSGYTEGVIRFGRISPEILNLPREERDKRLLAEAQERHNRLLQEALARDGDIGDIHGKSGHNENFDPLSPDPSGEGVGFGVPDDQMAVPGDAPERWSLETPPSDLGLDEDISEEELLRQIEAALKRDAAKKGEYDERQGRHPSAPTIVPERPPSQFNREAPDIPKRRGRRNSPDRETPPTKE